MLVERDLDCGRLYGEKRRGLVTLASSLHDDELRVVVPATPAWTVHDVVAHVVGIAADLNAGNFGQGDRDTWSDAQVVSRRGRSVAELAREWEAEAPQFEEGLRLLGYEIGSHYIGDLLQHTQDVHAALRRPPIEDDDALMAALDFYLDTFHRALVAAGAGAVVLGVDGEHVTVGTGAVTATLRANRFELFRALGGRRSAAQVRALPWSGDVEPVLAHVSAYPPPASDLSDSVGIDRSS